MERLEGLDEELEQEETGSPAKIESFEEAKQKRKPFHYWTVDGEDHKMKLTTGMSIKLENKYKMSIIGLVTASDIPPLSVMLTIAQAALVPWEHNISLDYVMKLYDKWLEEDEGSQTEFFSKVILPTLAVSGFFPKKMENSLMKALEEDDNNSLI
jgi:hypothetical protein